MDKNIILVLALLVLILVLAKYYINETNKGKAEHFTVEGEDDDKLTDEQQRMVNATVEQLKTILENQEPNSDKVMEIIKKNYDPKNNDDWGKIMKELEKCTKQYNWWDVKPVLSIISRYTGIGLNVCPIEQDCEIGTPEGNLNSSYTISLNTPSIKDTTKNGVITVDPDGTYSLNINMNSLSQRWSIRGIDNHITFNKYLAPSQQIGENELDRVPFWIIIKEPVLEGTNVDDTKQNRVLQYENGSISVRLLSNYEAQKWIISPVRITKPIKMISNSLYGSMTPEFTNVNNGTSLAELTESNTKNVMSGINKVYDLLMQQNKITPPSENEFGNKPLTLNLKLGGNASVLGGGGSGEGGETFTGGEMDVTARLNAHESEKDKKKEKLQLDQLIKEGQGLSCKIPNFEDYATQSDLSSCYGCSNL